MLNAATEWRLALARKIAPVYNAKVNVQAVIVFGSVAHNCADRFSDIEIAVFWCAPPSPESLEKAATDAQGKSWKFSGYDERARAWADEYFVDSVKIEVVHWPAETIAGILVDVVDNCDADFNKQNTVFMIQHAIVLYGEFLIKSWQAKAAHYPDELANVMVRNHLRFTMPFSGHDMLAERDEVPLLYENFCNIERRLLYVLMGLNRIYYPGFKWTRLVAEDMQIAPPQLFPRLVKVFRSDAVNGARELRQLIGEIFNLVELHMPDIDVSEVRAQFEQPYQSWERPEIQIPS